MSNDEGHDPLHTKNATGTPATPKPSPFEIHPRHGVAIRHSIWLSGPAACGFLTGQAMFGSVRRRRWPPLCEGPVSRPSLGDTASEVTGAPTLRDRARLLRLARSISGCSLVAVRAETTDSLGHARDRTRG